MRGLALGACVIVPFGTTTAVGYVVGFPDALPPDLPAANVRPIAARVAGTGADIAPAVLETARFLSRHYFCDIAQAVLSVVPQAQAAQTEKRFVLCDGYDAALPGIVTKSHREVILALSNLPERAATEAQLSALLGGAKVTSPIKILRDKKILREEWRVLPPKVSAKMVKAVRLLVTWDDAEAEADRRETAKKPAQATLLRKLIEIGGGPLPLAEAKAMGASESAVKRLAEDGVVAVEAMEVRRRPFRFDSAAAVPPVLMGEQEHAVADIKARLDSGAANTALAVRCHRVGKNRGVPALDCGNAPPGAHGSCSRSRNRADYAGGGSVPGANRRPRGDAAFRFVAGRKARRVATGGAGQGGCRGRGAFRDFRAASERRSNRGGRGTRIKL